jgi:hypothetical protein
VSPDYLVDLHVVISLSSLAITSLQTSNAFCVATTPEEADVEETGSHDEHEQPFKKARTGEEQTFM